MSQTIYSNNADVELHELLPVPSVGPVMSLPDGAVDNLTSVYDSIVYIGLYMLVTT